MRSLRTLAGLAMLVALTAACDSTQPLQAGQETFELRATGVAGQAKVFFVYDGYEDVNGNQQQDPGEDTFLFCKTTADTSVAANSMPWHFTLDVSILRAGATEPEEVTSSAALSLTGNQTEVDTSVWNKNVNFQGAITEQGHTFRFINPRVRTSMYYEVLASTTNPLFVLNPGLYGYGAGLCSLGDPGSSFIDGEPGPLVLDLHKGDTVIVKFRRTGKPAALSTQQYIAAPQIRVMLYREGFALLQPAQVQTTPTQDGVTYSYTSN